ncbi:unnamed protein product [Lactuca saligna]|uniref:DEAD-box helicase OB fold domain-containing protein n=1 Tax=Lactuca saligna TaxID=75948 RepID=A0AA35VMF5_LACSI|nr:unnamed protein product [Lactuca saligna]CAI9274596.1 unnamed protein product [Lactuca saligna]
MMLLKHNENSFLLKNVADGQVLLHSNSVNSRALRIPFPWLVFNEKIKANSIFLLDTTVVSDSVMLLFGRSISKGDIESLLPFLTPFLFDSIPFHDMKQDGHLKMLGGYK